MEALKALRSLEEERTMTLSEMKEALECGKTFRLKVAEETSTALARLRAAGVLATAADEEGQGVESQRRGEIR